jgi:HPt (histidine-containing phosphotransfer) domain-containing protein
MTLEQMQSIAKRLEQIASQLESPFGEQRNDLYQIVDEIKSEQKSIIYPSFKELHGRDAIAGQDYAPDAALCQDDYEYFTGTGQYA